MKHRKHNKSDRIFNLDKDPVDEVVDEIKDSATVLAKVLFAGFNIVFLVVLGVILIARFGVN